VRPRCEGESRLAVFRRASALASACAIHPAPAREPGGVPQLQVHIALLMGGAAFDGRADYAAAANRCTRPRSPPGVVIRFLPLVRAGCNGRREVSER
jgi:hypothetical protein